MNNSSQGKSHAMTWTLVLLIALPLLYLLSVPVIGYGRMRLTGHSYQESWILRYSTPYNWLLTETPLTRPLDAYDTWCFRLIIPLRSGAPVPAKYLDEE